MDDTLISAFADHNAADAAANKLYEAGFEMGDVSVIGKDWVDARDPTGYHSPDDTRHITTRAGVATGAGLGLLAGFALLGPLAILGPIAGLVAGAAVGGAAGIGVGQLFQGLMDPNEPDFVADSYAKMLDVGNTLLLVHGDEAVANRARPILNEAGALETRLLVRATQSLSSAD